MSEFRIKARNYRKTRPLVSHFEFFNHGLDRYAPEQLEALGNYLREERGFVPDLVLASESTQCYDTLLEIGCWAAQSESVKIGSISDEFISNEDVRMYDESTEEDFSSRLLRLVAFSEQGGIATLYGVMLEQPGKRILACTHVERCIMVPTKDGEERLLIEPPSFVHISVSPGGQGIVASYSHLVLE